MADIGEIAPVDLVAEHLLIDGGRARPVGGGHGFWSRLATDAGFAEEVGRGWLVASFDMPETWTTWEVHPEGDEIVHLERGRLRLVMEIGEREEVVELTAGATVVIPAGVWHTVEVVEPARALHVTHGRNTDHRPR